MQANAQKLHDVAVKGEGLQQLDLQAELVDLDLICGVQNLHCHILHSQSDCHQAACIELYVCSTSLGCTKDLGL